MKTLSLKLDDLVFQETERILTKVKKPRNRYINDALSFYNRLNKTRILARKLETESRLVQAESMKVLMELEQLD